jgi:carbamoyl-phosphate synthase large subunit
MNVMITSAGRRTLLLSAFKDAVKRIGGYVVVGDIDSLAPALYLADRWVKLPPVANKNYIEALKECVKNYNIGLLIPTIDTELLVLSMNGKQFKDLGCEVVISSPDFIKTSQDKWETVNHFDMVGIRTPESWLPSGDLRGLPSNIFIKPRTGSASQNTYNIHKDQLKAFLSVVPNPILQEYLPYEEITIDSLLDHDGNLIHYVPRKRIKTVGGESIQGVTITDSGYTDWFIKLFKEIAKAGGYGPLTIQAFLGPDGPILSEINPRFGGGFPLAYAAGGRYPQWIVELIKKGTISPRIGEYKKGLHMTRYYSEIFFENPVWEIDND